MENQTELNAVWESLGIANDFMFGKVMQDAELCKELLQRILPELEIDHVEYPKHKRVSDRMRMQKVSGWTFM